MQQNKKEGWISFTFEKIVWYAKCLILLLFNLVNMLGMGLILIEIYEFKSSIAYGVGLFYSIVVFLILVKWDTFSKRT